MNEWLGPRVNVAVAGVCGVACFVICAFAPSFPIYFASYVLFQGVPMPMPMLSPLPASLSHLLVSYSSIL